MTTSWTPLYKVGDEVYIVIYSTSKDTNFSPDDICKAKILGNNVNEGRDQYEVKITKSLWGNNSFLRPNERRFIHHGWIEEFSSEDVELILQALGLKLVIREKVQFT